MELSQAISQAIKEFGKDIITESRFVNILADYDAFAESRQMRMVVKDMVEQGFTKRLLSDDLKVNNIDDKIRSLVYDAQSIFPFREDLINGFISSTVKSIYGEKTILTSPQTSKKKISTSSPSSNAATDFKISKDGKTLIKAKKRIGPVVVIPEGVEIIKEKAFCENKYITEVRIPEGVRKIGFRAFADCPKLTDVQLPESLVEVRAYCFDKCYELKEIFLPKNVRIIGSILCFGKANVDSDNNYLKSIDGSVFSKDGKILYHTPKDIKSYDVPIGVEELYTSFCGCLNLQTVKLPDGLKRLDTTFKGCENIRNIKLPNGLESIDRDVFCFTESLTEITIPASVKHVDIRAFEFSKITNIIFKSKSPQRIKWNGMFDSKGLFWSNVNELEAIYVPKDAFEKYQETGFFDGVTLIGY